MSFMDMTPETFSIGREGFAEKLKKVIRYLIYPTFIFVNDILLEKKFRLKKKIPCDLLLFGQRGNDFEANRRKVDKYKTIRGSKILIIGCGTGRDIESWLKFRPKEVVAIDYFDYTKAWQKRLEIFREKYPYTKISFAQMDLNDSSILDGESFDIIGSDAVFEHLRNFKDSISLLFKRLSPGGVLYATFGPLYYCWGGDHISGSENIANGFNHILMAKDEYYIYLDSFGDRMGDEHDGRMWVDNDLFSYLKPSEYLKEIAIIGFEKKFVKTIIEPRALEFQKRKPDIFKNLADKYGENSLLITGMTIIYSK